MRRVLLLALMLGLGAGAWWWLSNRAAGPAVEYRLGEVQRGDVLAVVSATGTIEPEELVDVGAQVAGRIQNLGHDPREMSKSIDYGSQIEEGTVLARIDDALYAAQVAQAKATVSRAKADIDQQSIRLQQLEREWKRAQEFHKRNSISEADLDLARANWQAARAAVSVTEATLEQAKASLHQAEINLGYCTIRSPVKGVIIDRRVNVGQTVVASLNAPSLFLIAKDLRRLQVWASVNEADIGQIHEGQSVKFTVDARPNEVFRGTVSQIRLNATMTQNVVTYTVVVTTDNSELRLLPYLTATLQFERESRRDVLTVPNVALRWQPRTGPAGSSAAAANGGPKGGLAGGEPGGGPGKAPGSGRDSKGGRVWVREGDTVRPIEVQVGLTDGVVTEVEGAGLSEGLAVIVADVLQEASGPSSPFAPKTQGGSAPAAGTKGGGRAP
jgi:HlyD family secretion protein